MGLGVPTVLFHLVVNPINGRVHVVVEAVARVGTAEQAHDGRILFEGANKACDRDVEDLWRKQRHRNFPGGFQTTRPVDFCRFIILAINAFETGEENENLIG